MDREDFAGVVVTGMIGKDYFRRQASTLRKMVGVAQDKAVAAKLTFLADDFEAKAHGEADQPAKQPPPGLDDADGTGQR